MAYETRRNRRLRLEQQRRRQSYQRAGILLAVAVILLTLVGVVVYLGQQNLAKTSDPGASTSVAEVDETDGVGDDNAPTPTKGEIIAAGLPTRLAKLNQELGIAAQNNLLDLPHQTTTAVAMIGLDGQGDFSYGGDIQFTSASTYKIYVAYAMIRDVENGIKTWSSPLNGTTWEECLSRMMVDSDNACPEAYLTMVGFSKFSETVQSLGVSEQTAFAYNDMRTTADDLASTLSQLYRGDVILDENRTRLLGLMSRQIYRDGIPAGVGQSGVVYDKVGFMDGLLHDAGIVHTDQGDYVLVIMTNGESWPYIAGIASYINSVMAG